MKATEEQIKARVREHCGLDDPSDFCFDEVGRLDEVVAAFLADKNVSQAQLRTQVFGVLIGDLYGFATWLLKERCPVCLQADNCGDCDHTPS